MKENKTLAQLYQEQPRHQFGDISLIIENQGGKLRGKFVFHHIETDKTVFEKAMVEKGLPACFANPPSLINSDVVSGIVWDEQYKTLGDIIPIIEKEIESFSGMVQELGNRLAQCADCHVFERCYQIAEFNLKRRGLGEKKVAGNWKIE